jgi:hypothetical protein
MSVKKDRRALVVVSSLVTEGQWNWLYEYIDKFGVKVAQEQLGPHYARCEILKGSNATKEKFITTLQNLGAEPGLEVIDLIAILHGGKTSLSFEGSSFEVSDLTKEITTLENMHKLRMLYSLACYGANHAQAFVDAGFKVAVGARGVNANAADEYPDVLRLWSPPEPPPHPDWFPEPPELPASSIGRAIELGSDLEARLRWDNSAKLLGFPDADSEKVIVGDRDITIASGPFLQPGSSSSTHGGAEKVVDRNSRPKLMK